jgi:hypothetical protein
VITAPAGTYTVTSTFSGCTSGVSSSVTVNSQPAAPSAPTVSLLITYCQNSVAAQLSADAPIGSTLNWYTVAISGIATTTAPTPSTAVLGTTSFYVSSLTSSGCESVRSKIDVTVTICRVIYAYNDNSITPVNTAVSGNVRTNDDLNNGTTSLVVATTPLVPPIHGSVTLSSTGAYTYVPSPNYTGPDSFTYRVCDQGSLVACDDATVYIDVYQPIDPNTNNAPIVLGDAFTTTKGIPVSGSVLGNDADPDAGQTLTATQISNPSNGMLGFNADGTFVYTPNQGYVGDDSFIYTACDNGTPTECRGAVVQITVIDTPTPNTNLRPMAGDDLIITTAGIPKSGNVLANDKDSEGTTLVVNATPVSGPTNGTITLLPDGTYTYIATPGFVGTDRIVYDVCDAGTPEACTQGTILVQVVEGRVCIAPKVWLQGSLFGMNGAGTIMRDNLRVKGLIPLTSPYLAMGFSSLTPTGSIAPSVLTVVGADAIVDWIFIELRSATDNQQVLDSRSALVQRDGDIVDIDGVSPLKFTSAQPASYFVAVKHRNHLGVMSRNPIVLTTALTVVDFRLSSTPTYVLTNSVISQPQVVVDQGVALWAGNALYDDRVIYQGTANDINSIYQIIINDLSNVFSSPFFKFKAYNNSDINMDGEVIFQGTQNDVEFIYQNIIKNHPGNTLKRKYYTIKEQLP